MRVLYVVVGLRRVFGDTLYSAMKGIIYRTELEALEDLPSASVFCSVRGSCDLWSDLRIDGMPAIFLRGQGLLVMLYLCCKDLTVGRDAGAGTALVQEHGGR